MTVKFEEISALALLMPLRDRVRLGIALAESVSESDLKEFDEHWSREAGRRMQAFDDGLMGGRDVDAAYEELRRKLRE